MIIKNSDYTKFIFIILFILFIFNCNRKSSNEHLTYKKNYKILIKNIQNQDSIIQKLNKLNKINKINKVDTNRIKRIYLTESLDGTKELTPINKKIKNIQHKQHKKHRQNQSVGKASRNKSVGEASRNKSVGEASRNKSVGEASRNKSVGEASKQIQNIAKQVDNQSVTKASRQEQQIQQQIQQQQQQIQQQQQQPVNEANIKPMTDPVYIRDNQVLNDNLYPPLGRTERPQFDLLMNFMNNQPDVFNMYTRGPPDTFRMLGYLTPLTDKQTIDSTLILYGRAKWQNSDIGDFYATSSSKISHIKIPLTQYNCNIRRIWDIPEIVEIHGSMLAGEYNFTELPKPDLTHPYI